MENQSPDDDHDAIRKWLEAIARGDRDAMNLFYDSTVSRVYAVALRVTACPNLAEEVVNDVYLQVWRKASQYDAGRANPITWLMMICRSRGLDSLRRQRTATQNLSEEIDTPVDTANPEPCSLSESLEHGSLVQQALLKLKDEERRMLELAFFKGLSHTEIADTTGKPLGTVKTTIRRGQIALREEMTRQGYVHDEVIYEFKH